MRNLSVFTTLSLLVSIILSETQVCESIRCNPQDKQVLLKIKQALNNPYDLASWNPDTDCCYWYIVKCDRKTNRIITFNLITSTTISGPIPDAVADLPYLQSLTFHKLPNLTGTIPLALTKLTNLKMLTISWTNISGLIPSYLTQLKNLTLLDLSFNNLSGPIPPSLSLAHLHSLNSLMLDRNKLTGSIPGDLPPSLQYLDLSHNQLSGSIPMAWGGLNFTTLLLQRNRLQGDASLLFGNNKSIQNADLSRNMLQFDLSKVEIPDSLRYLDLNHNRIFGTLPAALEPLTFLNVSYNRLCGRIPTGGVLQEMDYSSFFHNKCLCGPPLPDCKSSLQ